MRKTAIPVTVATLVLGIFGAFLRWLQNTGAYEAETGCIAPHHSTTIVLVIYCILSVAVILVANLLWLRRYEYSEDVSALRSGTVLPAVIGWVFGVVFALAACVIMFSADAERFPTARRLLGAVGILAGLCIPFLPGKRDGSGHGLGRTAAAVLTLFCCFWLVCSWRDHSENPVLWVYVMEILAIAANTAAFYYIAAYHYGTGRSGRALPVIQLAVFFDVVTLFDDRSAVQSILLLIFAGMLLLTELLLIENAREKHG